MNLNDKYNLAIITKTINIQYKVKKLNIKKRGASDEYFRNNYFIVFSTKYNQRI